MAPIIDLSEVLTHDPERGMEVRVRAENGNELRSDSPGPGKPIVGAAYVRVLDPEGRERARWDRDAWEADPSVMGDIIGCLLGFGE